MRVERRTAEELAWLSKFTGAVTGVLGALAAFGSSVGAPTMLRLVAGGLAVIGGLAILYLLVAERRHRLLEHASEAGDVPDQGPSTERLEAWRRRLRDAVREARLEAGGQLDLMIRHSEAIYQPIKRVHSDVHRPRPQVEGRLVAWEEITREWDASPGRLLILGEPGYGKTVAALTLIAHINASDGPGEAVAELFSLADWYRWMEDRHTEQDGQTAPLLSEWLAGQLARSYAPLLPLARSQQLIAAGLVLPVLDGLDEVPTTANRRACVEAIAAYARRVKPHRPFVLTCRFKEYSELRSGWVAAERQVALAGLQPDQVRKILARTPRGTGWDAIRAGYEDNHEVLRTLFRSPLRLTIALQAYRDRDPSELLDLTLAQAQARLWEHLLSVTAHAQTPARGRLRLRRHRTFRDAERARGWLVNLAVGMDRWALQRLTLDRLDLIDPDTRTSVRRFWKALRRTLLLAGGVAGGSTGLFTGGLGGALAGALAGALVGALVGALTLGIDDDDRSTRPPTVRAFGGWRATAEHAIARGELAMALIIVLPLSLVVWLLGGLGGGVAGGVVFGALAVLLTATAIGVILAPWDWSYEATARLDSWTDPRFMRSRRRAGAALATSRNAGLAVGLAVALVDVLAVGIVAGLLGDRSFGLGAALTFGVAYGAANGLINGLDAWLYHYWMRWRLSSSGLLPRRLPAFLSWCAEPARGWLRFTDAYEFRHRELLDHLVATARPPVDDRIDG